MITIGSRISQLIAALGIKKVDFARRLNLSQPFVSELCSGKGNPSDRTILDICREFDVNEDWLRTGDGEMFATHCLDEDISDYVAKILSDKDAALQRRIVAFMSRIPPDCWNILEKKALEVFGDDKKEAQE